MTRKPFSQQVLKYGLILATIGSLLPWAEVSLGQVHPSLLSFHKVCAQRGDSQRHQNIINPLQDHKVFCDQAAKNRQSLINPTFTKPSQTFTLCNWNVYGLPIKKSGRRQKHIADIVAYGCDIFAGQEHWSIIDRASFRKQARQHVPSWNFKYFGHPLLVHPGSGVMIGSIWPIVKTRYSPWPGGLFKNAGYKGVGYAQLKTPYGLLDLYNLHLAAGRNRALKEKQLQHLVQFVQATHEPHLPLIVTGDFNFGKNWRLQSNKAPAFQWLSAQLGVRAVGFQSRIEHTFLNQRVNYHDFRILADWATAREVYMSCPFIRELTDHPGVVTRLSIQPASLPQGRE